MPAFDHSPITDRADVEAFLDGLPLAVDRERFTRFVLGFPHGYLQRTAPVEIVRHFALMESLGGRACVSSLGAEGDLWRLWLVTRDREALLSRLAGSLSCFGVDILEAEAFANESGLVLDSFLFSDTIGRFGVVEERRRFQAFLGSVLDGSLDLDAQLMSTAADGTLQGLSWRWPEDPHPKATLLTVAGRDHHGLLFELTRQISSCNCSIDLAHIKTPSGEVRDEFFLTRDGQRLPEDAKREIEARLAAAGALAVSAEGT